MEFPPSGKISLVNLCQLGRNFTRGFLGSSLSFEEKSVLLFNVYFPTTGWDGDDDFSHYIGRIT